MIYDLLIGMCFGVFTMAVLGFVAGFIKAWLRDREEKK